MAGSHVRPQQDEPDTRKDEHPGDSASHLSEAEAATQEIVSIRRMLAEIDQGRSAVPVEAGEAIRVLDNREHELRERLAELQGIFSDPRLELHLRDEVPDRSSLFPPV